VREQLSKGHKLIVHIAPHKQVGLEVAQGVPLPHLQQRERPLDVLLRVDILPTRGRALELRPMALDARRWLRLRLRLHRRLPGSLLLLLLLLLLLCMNLLLMLMLLMLLVLLELLLVVLLVLLLLVVVLLLVLLVVLLLLLHGHRPAMRRWHLCRRRRCPRCRCGVPSAGRRHGTGCCHGAAAVIHHRHPCGHGCRCRRRHSLLRRRWALWRDLPWWWRLRRWHLAWHKLFAWWGHLARRDLPLVLLLLLLLLLLRC